MNMKSVISKRRESERQNRISKIITAARKLFLKKGYQGTSIRDIARKAELSTGAIYFYFKGKDEIYSRICLDIFGSVVKLLKEGSRNEGSISQRLEAITMAYVRFYTDYPDDFDLLDFAFKKPQVVDELTKNTNQILNQGISLLNDVFADAIRSGYLPGNLNSLEVTMSFWASIEGLLYFHKRDFLKDLDLNLDRMVKNQISIFLRGLGG